MPDREQVLRQAIEAGLNVLRSQYGDGFRSAQVLENIPLLASTVWHFFDGYMERAMLKEFESLLIDRFPKYTPVPHGSTSFEYIVSNVQGAVIDDILCIMDEWIKTMETASHSMKFHKDGIPDRDWEVGIAHIKELVSEVKQYRSRGLAPQTGNLSITTEATHEHHHSPSTPRDGYSHS